MFRNAKILGLLLTLIALFWLCLGLFNSSETSMDAVVPRYLKAIGVKDISQLRYLLIVPLGGCNNHIRPVLEVIDKYYPCEDVPHSQIVFDADFTKQLSLVSKFETASQLPTCITFDRTTRAFFNQLVYFSPIIYEFDGYELKQIISIDMSETYSEYLNKYFHIDLTFIEEVE